MHLLHLDSSILAANSVSRQLSASTVAKLVEGNPDATITYRDLAADPISHLSGAYLAACQGLGPDAGGHIDLALEHDLATGARVLEEFLAADTVVIGVGFYNFGISSQLKAWVDRIAVAGKTFHYTEHGPEGLAGKKRVVLAIARGGLYSAGSPAASFEHAETYLRGILAFMGITNPEVIVAEGLATGPEAREQSITAAEARIAELV
jgi:FMN-dependent NADH-azoreductase